MKKVSIFFFFFSLRLSSCPKVTTFPGLKPVEKVKKNSFEDVKKSATLPRSKIRFRHLVVVQQRQRQVPSQRRDIHRRKIEILIFAKSRSDEKRENILFDFFSRKKMRRAKISQSLKSTEIIRRKSELKSWQYFFNLT